MRLRQLSPLLGLVAACVGGGDGPAGVEPAGPAPRVVLQGTVLDSLLGKPVAGAAVLIADADTVTGPDGRFRLEVPAGLQAFVVIAPGHEIRQGSLRVPSITPATFMLRRVAPTVLACGFASDTLRAIIVDLQGRKTVNRREGARLLLVGETDSLVLAGGELWWTPVDYLTWLVRAAVPLERLVAAVWRVPDTDGNLEAAACASLADNPGLPE